MTRNGHMDDSRSIVYIIACQYFHSQWVQQIPWLLEHLPSHVLPLPPSVRVVQEDQAAQFHQMVLPDLRDPLVPEPLVVPARKARRIRINVRRCEGCKVILLCKRKRCEKGQTKQNKSKSSHRWSRQTGSSWTPSISNGSWGPWWSRVAMRTRSTHRTLRACEPRRAFLTWRALKRK